MASPLAQTAGRTGPPAAASAPTAVSNAAASRLVGRVIAGYQGWFGCPGDQAGSGGWRHWLRPDGGLRMDMLPDVSMLPPAELCASPLRRPDGSPVMLYSSRNRGTVLQHFRMMQAAGIDGVAQQRFIAESRYPDVWAEVNHVLGNVRAAAEATGRSFFVMYDVSGAPRDRWAEMILADWRGLVASGLLSSPAYQRQDGRPVLSIWGIGYPDLPPTPEATRQLAASLDPDGKTLTLMAGVPWDWRRKLAAPSWLDALAPFRILSPWSVGAYRTDDQLAWYDRTMLEGDIQLARGRGQILLPVVFPGFSAAHLRSDPASLDRIPRRCGRLLQAQIDGARAAGAQALYVAMLDEFDEGTAILPTETNPALLPRDDPHLVRPPEGCMGGQDTYLRIAGQAARALRRDGGR